MSREKLSAEVREEIEGLIGTEFKKGEKIPSEEELCRRFNVSRTTLREAIKELSARHVLEVRRGIGTFVTHHPGLVEDPIGIRYMHDENLMEDIWETSLLIEPQLAAWTAARASAEEIAEIASVQDEIASVYKTYKKNRDEETVRQLFDLDGQFHTKIAKYTGNNIIYYIYRSYCGIIQAELGPENVAKASQSIMKYHPLLVADFQRHDSEAAMQHMRAHDEEIARKFRK